MRRTLPVSFLLLCAVLVAPACKKPDAAPFDAGAAPAPVPTDAAPAVLAPLEEDAGTDAGVDAAPVRHAGGGGGLNTTQSHAKQCCSAIRAQGKTDPMLSMLANQCDAFAVQLGPTAGGEAPELAPLRAMLKNAKSLPPICQGL